jgi:hypothetical protein
MCQALLQFSHFGMLAYTKMRAQALSSTVPAHSMCQTLLIVFTFMDAALHTAKRSSALKCRACAQNVSDTTHIFYILVCCPTPRYWDKCCQVSCLRTECVKRYYHFFILGCWPTSRWRLKWSQAPCLPQNVSDVTHSPYFLGRWPTTR